MSSALHFILLFSGLWTPAKCVTRRFYVVKAQKNWSEAQKYCRGIYTDLATIENQEDMDTVVALAKLEKANYCIGMKQKADQNNNNWVWSDGSNSTYSCWGDKEPNNGGNDNCVQLYKTHSYKWNDAECHHKGPFICYKTVDFQLILFQLQMTWREALRFCRENYVDLVSVHTNETQDWVATVTKHANTSNVWMGLRHTCTLGLWYQNWAPGNGTVVENCSSGERTGAVQSGNKKWISLPDTQELNFICTI